MTTVNKREQICESLRDQEYRQQFVDEEINVGIAFQIRSLRNRQKLTQSDLAKKLNAKQPLVSAWENPEYGKYSIATLKELAKVFDVGLLVRFVSFSKLVDLAVNLSSESIAPPSFKEEEQECQATSSTVFPQVMKSLDANNLVDSFNRNVPNVSKNETTNVKEPIYA